MWRIPTDEAALRSRWTSAEPFPHVVIDDPIDPDRLGDLMAILDEEGVQPYANELYAFDATAPQPTTDAFRELRASFAQAFAPLVSTITGKSVSTIDLRAYAYHPGHYLLPHADHQEGLDRKLAFACYLPGPTLVGGELELYRCAIADGVITSVASATIIEPRANRLVVFDVSDISLHRVREVLDGVRISLAGWFYP